MKAKRSLPAGDFDRIDEKLEAPPADAALLEKPYWLNQYVAGYHGYLALQTLAGYPEDQEIRATYEELLRLRIDGFDKDSPFPAIGSGAENWEMAYHNSLAVARNFMFLTPELGQILGDQIQQEVREAVDEYSYVAPYWFVSKFDNSYGEGSLQHLYDYPALFQAKAYALNQPFQELSKWLDAPAFPIGDLFYIQNLAAALASPDSAPVRDFNLDITPSLQVIEAGDAAIYRIKVDHAEDFSATIRSEIGASPSPELDVALAPFDRVCSARWGNHAYSLRPPYGWPSDIEWLLLFDSLDCLRGRRRQACLGQPVGNEQPSVSAHILRVPAMNHWIASALWLPGSE